MNSIKKRVLIWLLCISVVLSNCPVTVFANEIPQNYSEDIISEMETDTEIEVENEVETEVETEAETEVETEAETEVETEAESETETEAETEEETEVETEVETEIETEAETEVETEAEMEVETESEVETEVETEAEPEESTEVMEEPETETEVETEAELVESTEDVSKEELEQDTETSFDTGLMDFEVVYEMIDDATEVFAFETLKEISMYSTIYNNEWDKYSTNYHYNQLDSDWKVTWDALDALCLSYLTSTDAIPSDGMTYIELPEVVEASEAANFALAFVYSNPQYYFLLNKVGYATTSTGSKMYVKLFAYDAFLDGAARQTATSSMKAQIDIMAAEVNACATEAQKVQKANDLICNKIAYDHDIVVGGITSEEEQSAFTQSAYSTFCMDKTVCAGYADAMTMLCNAAGVDAMSVTSADHQWNKVRVDDTWYNVDATWADQNDGIYYQYFFRSDDFYAADNTSHIEEACWEGISPACVVDVVPESAWVAPGVCPVVTNTVATPVISVSENVVSISTTTPNAEIYYTLDGTDPAVASAKAHKYTGSFQIEEGCQVRAIAACNTYFDSAVAVYEEKEYKINSITLSKDTIELTESLYEDTITVTLEATGGDESTAFELWYENPDTTRGFHVMLNYQQDGVYVGEIYACYLVNGVAYEKENVGVYTLSSIYPQDGNTYDYTGITSQFTYNVTVDDVSAPVVNEVKLYDSNGDEVVAGQTFQKTDTITIKMDITDDSQIDSVRLENPYYVYVWYDEEEQAYVETINLENLETGVHYISINAEDIYGNYADFYYNDSLYFYVVDENEDMSETTYMLNFYMDGENSMEVPTYEVTGKGAISLKELFPEGIPEAPTYEGVSLVGWEIADVGIVTEEEEFVPRSTELNICPVYDKCRIVAKFYYFSDPLTYNTAKYGGYNTSQNIAFFVDNKEITKEEFHEGIHNRTFDISSITHSEQLEFQDWNVSELDYLFESCGDVILQATYDECVAGLSYFYVNEAGEFDTSHQEAIVYEDDDTYEEVVKRITGDHIPHTKKYTFMKWLNAHDDAYTTTLFQGGRIALKASYIAIDTISLSLDTVTLDAQTPSANIDVFLEVADMVFQNFDMQGADEETEFQLIYTADDGYEIPVTLSYQDGTYVGKINLSGDDYKGEGDFVLSSITVDGKEINYASESKFTLVNNITVDKEYTITYELDGGKNNSSNPTSYYTTTETITLKNPTRTGYTFAGWYSDSSHSTKVTQITKGSTGNKTFYAKWTPNKYTIAFNGNGATSGTMSSMTSRSYDTSYNLTTNAYKKTGYTFTGWNTKADGSGTTYANKASVKNLSSKNGATVTLYAQWKKTKYTVTYELNGGTNNKSNPTSYYVDSATKTLQNPTRKGYTFGGWYTSSTYKTKVTQITKGSTGNKTLYANWTANKYNIKFAANGGSGTMSSLTNCSYGTSYNLTANAYKKTGYKFVGWNTKADGSGTTYANKESVKNLSATNKATVTLYAQWQKVKYTITYQLNGGTNSSSNPTSYYVTTPTKTLQNPTRKGYTFGGWYSDSSYKTKVTQIKKGSTGNKTLYAKWTANKYTIKFDGNGATSGTMNSLTKRSYGKSYTLTANAYKRTGYKFTGWNTKADGSGTTYANKASVKNLSSKNGATVTLYAQWQKVKYTITYELNGGTNNKNNPTSYYVTTATKTLQNPTKTGYTFKGWYSDSKYKTKVTEIKKGSTGNKTFYAKWAANTYSIAFDGNGSTGGKMSSLTSRSYGKSYALTANAYKRTGYKFTGWNTKADGSGTSYANEASVKNLSSKNGATVTLYAQWQKVKYTITYELNGGTNNKNNPTAYYVTTATKTLQSPTKTGYTFKGWYSDSSYKNKVTEIKKGSTGNKTFYAKWAANTYSIAFDGNGATSGTMSSLTSRSYGTSYTLTANAYKRDGYKFTGWNTKADGSGTTYANKASVKNLTETNGATVILYAQWQEVDTGSTEK